jgi:hypothetical protein
MMQFFNYFLTGRAEARLGGSTPREDFSAVHHGRPGGQRILEE